MHEECALRHRETGLRCEVWFLRKPTGVSCVEARTDAHRTAHGDTFTFLHAISKRPLLVAQASRRDGERQDDGMSRLCCDTIGPDGLRIAKRLAGRVVRSLRHYPVSSVAPPFCSEGLGHSHVTAEALGVCAHESRGVDPTFVLFCILFCISINWVLKSYTVRNRMQKLISLM